MTDPTALRLEGLRMIEEARTLLAERKDMEMALWSFDNLPTLLQSLAALTEERDEAWHEYSLIYQAHNALKLEYGMAERRAEAAEAWAAAMEAALDLDANEHTYRGVFSFKVSVELRGESGKSFVSAAVPWETLKEIFAAIRAKAALAQPGTGGAR